nr:division plane positioning ATPase MipZ [Escherichia coli]
MMYKGGVGKIATVTNLASYLVNNSQTVFILKTDKNNDILSWNEKRKQNGLLSVPVYEEYGDVSEVINCLKKICEVLIIDCPGHDSKEFRSALTIADTLLTLVKPSLDFEAETLTHVTEKVHTAQQINPGLQPGVLFTRINTTKSRHRKAAIDLDKLLRENPVWIQPLRTRISDLDIFSGL